MMTNVPKVFGNKIRLKIMRCLAGGKRDVSFLVEECGLSQSAVSQHLQILTDTGVIEKSKEGRNVYCDLKDPEYGIVAKKILEFDED